MSTITAPRAESSTDTLKSINPATGEVVGKVPITPPGEIPAIVARARAAQKQWRRMSFDERAAAILPAGDRLLSQLDELALLLTREMGKPLPDATGEIKGCASTLKETLDDIAAALEPETLEDAATRTVMHFDPLGVAAVISPWNFPLAMPHWMVIPALVAGNTVVLKPSEETPLIAQAYAESLIASLPTDVLQIIHGADQQGRALVDADVDLVAFTGSRETGMKIMEAAGRGLKRLVLELGGKDPLIVLRDADVEKAAEFAARNSFRNAGQVCVSTERIYVDEAIADQFEEAFIRFTKDLTVGDGTQPDVKIGPMINQRQHDHVVRQVDEAIAQGARIIFGGEGHHGNFFMPTILTDVTHDVPIMRDETFGPVTCVMRVRSDEEAADLANDTPFGLGAVVFGEAGHAGEVARQLEAGMVGINKSCGGAAGSPWVGAKHSGFGYHSGKSGHRQFSQTRIVSAPKG